jgi:hypothetical protein
VACKEEWTELPSPLWSRHEEEYSNGSVAHNTGNHINIINSHFIIIRTSVSKLSNLVLKFLSWFQFSPYFLCSSYLNFDLPVQIMGTNVFCWLCPTATGYLKDGTEFQNTNNWSGRRTTLLDKHNIKMCKLFGDQIHHLYHWIVDTHADVKNSENFLNHVASCKSYLPLPLPTSVYVQIYRCVYSSLSLGIVCVFNCKCNQNICLKIWAVNMGMWKEVFSDNLHYFNSEPSYSDGSWWLPWLRSRG